MAIPLIALVGAGLLAKTAMDSAGANVQRKHARRLMEEEKRQARKDAIARAMQGKYSPSPFMGPRRDPPEPPNMAPYQIVGGLGDIVATLAGSKIKPGGGA